ncbi:MAG: matrix protein [Cirsium cytorhabdovirus 1]|nr:MAG: matrix protein [Cirsium cytorhabdovirus 1]
MEGSIIDKLRSKSKNGSEKGSEEPSNPSWVCVSLYREQFEVEIGDHKTVKDLGAESIRERITDLIAAESGPENEQWIRSVFAFLFKTRRIGSCVDCYSSPFFGSKTKRISYVLDKHNIFYDSPTIIPGRYKINALGKKTTIGGTPVRATIRLVIAVKKWDEAQIENIKSQGYDWFCGGI